jgi:single-strand DNA-binding protein
MSFLSSRRVVSNGQVTSSNKEARMSDLNRVTVSGRLLADPELKYLPSGTAVANLRLASNRAYTSNGERRDQAVFVDVEVYGKSAESLSQYKHKGAFILVDGRLRQHAWEKDGQRRSRLSVVADHVSFGPTTGARSDANPATEADGYEKEDLPF